MIRTTSSLLVNGLKRGGGLTSVKKQQHKCLSTIQKQQKEQQDNTNEVTNSTTWTFPPESGFIQNSPYDNITIRNLTLDQFVWKSINEWENKIATVSTKKTLNNPLNEEEQ